MRILRTLWRAVQSFIEIDGEQRAAAFAYYALFSLFPLFALILSLGSALFDSHAVIKTVQDYFPLAEAQQVFIWNMVDSLERSRGGVTVISFLVLVWSSLKFFQALVRGVNRAWHTEDLPWWQLPLKNLMMIAVLVSALLIGLVAPALLQAIKKVVMAFADLVEKTFPWIDLQLVLSLFDWGRFLFAGAVLFYCFTLLYMLVPARRVAFQRVWMPALGVTIALQVCQNVFVNILPQFVDYNAIYGTVGIVMLLLMWVYVSGVVIFFGACVCAVGGDKKPPITPSSLTN